MKKVLTLVIGATLFAITPHLFAAGKINTNKVIKLAFQSNHLFLYADSWNNPNGCQNSNAVVLQSTDPNFDKAYSLLLAAFMAGKNVTGYSDGCLEWDGKTYNTIRGYKYLEIE